MAEDDDEGFSFGDFKFAQPITQHQPLHNKINGVTTSPSQYENDDDEWGDFFVANAPSSLQFNLANGFSLSNPKSPLPPKPSLSKPSINRSDLDQIKPKGALPLSFFGGEEEEQPDLVDNSNGWFDPEPNQNGINGFKYDGVFGKLHLQKNSGLDFDGENDDWEFKGVNGHVERDSNLKLGGHVLSGMKVESSMLVTDQEKQAGQGASSLFEKTPGSSCSLPQFNDFFPPSHGDIHQPGEMDFGFDFKPTTIMSNGFKLDSFSGKEISGESGITTTSLHEDDLDEFGDFIDASQEVGSQEQDQVVAYTNLAEAQLPNGKTKDEHTQSGSSRGALPLSLFGDATEESSDFLNYQNDMVHKPIPIPRNGFSSQSSGISIHVLLSNLYSQAQQTSTVDFIKKPTENGVHSLQKSRDSTPLSGDDDGEDNSWEFKGAFSKTGFKEQSSSPSPGNVKKLTEASSNLHSYMDFYAKLRDALCFLLSCQLDEAKRDQSSDTVTGNDGKAESLDVDIQEAYKLLQGSMTSQEFLSKKHLERSSCLDEFTRVLQEPKFEVIESEFILAKRLQLAANDWRTAADLLRHAIATLKILSLGSADEQSVYVSNWSKIVKVCAQELKCGALIWKRASDKNLRHHILSDYRGQRYIQALGEIFKVVQLLGLSAKLYKPWMLLRVSDVFGLLDECYALWSSSRLEEALQEISDDVGFGHSGTANSLIASIKNIRDLDLHTVHDCVFIQQKPLCQLSLLPQEMLADTKTVLWNEKFYFLNLANLWANLVSCDPPQLPHLQV